MALVLKTILHAICLPGMIVIGVPWLIMTPWLQPLFPKHYVGLIPFALGFVAMVWCMVEFVARGRGTPLPNDPPKLLVERGPYRWTRNPMYVGVLLMLIGEAVTFASTRLALYAFGTAVALDFFVRLYEEPSLHARFGDSYRSYCERVPRWILRLSQARTLKS